MRGLLLNDSLPAHARHLWSSLDPSCSLTHRCLWGTTRRRRRRTKRRCGVYIAKNNQTKTIWRAGMLPFIASENMFKVISLKDLHNCKRNYSRGRKKRKHQTICFCAQSTSSYAQHNLPTGHSCFFCFNSAAKYYACSYVDNATFTSILVVLALAQAPFKVFT